MAYIRTTLSFLPTKMRCIVSETATLGLYFVVVLGVIALPGLDMAYVAANSLVGGRSAGLAAVAGIVVGGICHVVMGALGVATLVRLWPALFNLLLVGGAAYIGWIGWRLARAGEARLDVPADAAAKSASIVFLNGMLTCLLNPKAYVFMLAIFPQFLHPARGPIWLQAAALGLITAGTQAGVYGGVALLARRAGHSLGASALATRAVGVLLVCTGIVTVVQGWQSA
jgi:threonine/homoserine/homoserine lactone efflux protein